MVQASTYSKAIVFTCSLGIALAAYAYIVEERKSQDAKYQAVCDLSEHMSCSRVLTSPYAKGFGLVRHVLGEDSPLNVPNSIPGGALFSLFALLSFLQRAWTARIQVGLAILANISSVYLGAILYFVLKDFCVICVSIYALNFILLVLSYLRLRVLTSTGKQAGKQKGQQKPQKGQKGGKQQQNDKQKSPQAEKKKSEKQKSPQAEKQKQNQQNGKVKNQANDKQKSPKTPNSKKKN